MYASQSKSLQAAPVRINGPSEYYKEASLGSDPVHGT